MKLPFWLYPRHWGLKGAAKELALIDYNYSGVEAKLLKVPYIALTDFDAETMKLDIKFEHSLIDEYTYEIGILKNKLKFKKIKKYDYDIAVLDTNLKYNNITQHVYDTSKIDLDLKQKLISDNEAKRLRLYADKTHHIITEQEFDTQMVELVEDELERSEAALRVNLKYGDITEKEFDKEMATLHKEPWSSLELRYLNDENSIEVMLDYNSFFVQNLRDTGHPGITDEEVVDFYINDCGRKLSSQEEENETIVESKVNKKSDSTFTVYQ